MIPNPLAAVDSETIAHLEFDANGRLSTDSAAAGALNALQPSAPADKCAALENLYQRWRYPDNQESRWAKMVWKLARTPLSIFRQQIATLAIALQESEAADNQTLIQANNQAGYLKLCGDLRELRKFLLHHYPGDMERAESLNEPLLEVCKRLMLRQRD